MLAAGTPVLTARFTQIAKRRPESARLSRAPVRPQHTDGRTKNGKTAEVNSCVEAASQAHADRWCSSALSRQCSLGRFQAVEGRNKARQQKQDGDRGSLHQDTRRRLR